MSQLGIRDHFIAFKANPSGPLADGYLRDALRAIERIVDQKTKSGAATIMAQELHTIIRSSSEQIRSQVILNVIPALDESLLVRACFGQASAQIGEAQRRSFVGRQPTEENVLSHARSTCPSLMFIDPDNSEVLAAAKRAVRKFGPISLSQIFDVFDYVVRSIEYLTTSDGTTPRKPSVTLRGGVGDCKNMAVVLSSMLEAIGAKTIYVMQMPRDSNIGHGFIAVSILETSLEDANSRTITTATVRSMLYGRYAPFIKMCLSGRNPDITFLHLKKGTKIHTCLLLDPTIRDPSIPGIAYLSGDLEYFEVRLTSPMLHAPKLD